MSQEIFKKVKCSRCGHVWDTKSTHVLVSCPSCYLKIKIEKSLVK